MNFNDVIGGAVLLVILIVVGTLMVGGLLAWLHGVIV